jgi:hypothetical protein
MSKDETVLEILTDFLDAVEAAAVNAKRQISHIPQVTPLEKALGHDASQTAFKGSPKLPFDASKIQWLDRENEKGKFQSSEDLNSPDHKALLAFLNEHVPNKCVQSEGRFYWIYPNGSTIGRKETKYQKKA